MALRISRWGQGSISPVSRHTRPSVLLALTALFGFRLLYGLSMPFWFEDERQVYLIGLQSFARGEWPYFGADVVWTGGQVPGALLGWLIRLPLELWSAPESPVVFLNLLSFAALALLAWYLSRRLSGVPRWLIWMSLFMLPWTLTASGSARNRCSSPRIASLLLEFTRRGVSNSRSYLGAAALSFP